MRNPLIGIGIAALLAGCTGDSFSDYRELSDSGWAYSDTVTFVPQAPAAGTLMVGLRHAADYPYRNLWLEVAYTPAGRETVHRDTVEVELANRFGLWLSRGVGSSRQTAVQVRPGLAVDSGKPLTVRHIMRLDTLRGVEQIGVFIVKPTE